MFQDQTQTLDQQFVSPALLTEVTGVRAAHVNADWPAAFTGDGARGVSDHDPQVARYTTAATIDRLSALLGSYAGAVEPAAAAPLQAALDRASTAAGEGRPLAARLALLRFRLLARARALALADQLDPRAAAVLRQEASLIPN